MSRKTATSSSSAPAKAATSSIPASATGWAAPPRSRVISPDVLSSITPISLVGNSFGQSIYGNAGNNFLNGGGGADVLVGFGGDDSIFRSPSATETIVERPAQGRDIVYASVNYALAAGIQVEVLSTVDIGGTAAIDLTGNELVQEIYGNAGANFLRGGGGADILIGFGGDDIYFVTSGGDDDRRGCRPGRATSSTRRSSYVLTAGARGRGAVRRPRLGRHRRDQPHRQRVRPGASTAMTAPTILNGGGGADVLIGLGGNDTYFVDMRGDECRARPPAAAATSVYAVVELHARGRRRRSRCCRPLRSAGTAAIDLTGNELGQEIYGNAGANMLDGGGGAD